MGNITEKAKKKKARQDKIRKASMFAFAITVGFLQTASSYYLRQIYNIKTLFPTWGLSQSDIMFASGDMAILKRQVGSQLLVGNNLLIAEQVREICIILIVLSVAYIIGKNLKERFAFFLFFGGLSAIVYYISIYSLLRWPESLSSKAVIALVPLPIVCPIYMPVLLSCFAFIAGLFLVFKKS